ncbi:hypothetical protein J6X15_03710 [Candidatus Saccharibacteria bacterium]|nr:hypothetical protein [Candidatus Saccharibacteria bacterium]
MSDYDYWEKQGITPLYPEVDLEEPEQRRLAGKILIIGGNKNAFFTVANAMSVADKIGAGEVRVLMPSSVKGQVPVTPEVYFAEAEKSSGVFGKAAVEEMLLQADWADMVVLIGDVGKNAETTVAMSEFLRNCNKPVFITRDAIDVVTPEVADWSMLREAETSLLLTMPQLQKLLRTLYYPKVITLSMPTNQLIESLHKFTLSYHMTLVTFHNEQIIIAQNGNVITQALSDVEWTQLTLWNGTLAVQMALIGLWNSTIDNYKCFASTLLIGNK